MKLLKNVLATGIFISLSASLSLAGPRQVSGPEDYSYVCPSPNICASPSPCPRLNCEICPSCDSPSPSPSSPSKSCELYSLVFKHGSNYKRGDLAIDQVSGGSSSLNCFEDIINKTLKQSGVPENYSSDKAYKLDGSKVWEKFTNTFTWYLWDNILAKAGLTRATYAENKSLINCTGRYGATNSAGHNAGSQLGGGTGGKNSSQPGCKSGKMYLKPDTCEPVKVSEVDQSVKLCGSLDFYSEINTPVSLVWSDTYKDTPSTLVGFKLNPYSDDNTWLWRGSDALPLLVYDPEHTGVINSATQLFGSWTFGGNGLASLIEGHSKGTPWRDGYEALSKMDKNLDGKVSGDELKDIALWFDKNQDGISQKGEVKTLSELSVTALYYNADTKEEGAIVATKGYERQVDGKSILASSMDWSEKSLKDGLGVLLDGLNTFSANKKVSSSNNIKPISSEHAKVDAPEVYGVWGWSLDLPASGSGYFAFDPSQEGVAGVTISQVGISGKTEVGSQVLFSHFVGSTAKNSEGLAELKFATEGENGTILTNTASLSKDGTQFFGKTVVTGSSLSESGTYEYSWKAERIK